MANHDRPDRFQERVFLPRWLLACLWALSVGLLVVWVLAVLDAAAPAVAYLLLVVGVLLPLALTAIHTRVYVGHRRVALRLWPLWRTEFSARDIRAVQVRPVVPLRDLGGLGLRLRLAGSGRRALVMRAGAAVEVELADGRTLLIGTSTPDRLVAALQGT